MHTPEQVSALLQYVSTLEEPLQEINNQIAKYAQLVMNGETGVVSSMTIKGKSFSFTGALSAGEMLTLWTEIKRLFSEESTSARTATGISFNVIH